MINYLTDKEYIIIIEDIFNINGIFTISSFSYFISYSIYKDYNYINSYLFVIYFGCKFCILYSSLLFISSLHSSSFDVIRKEFFC